MKMFALLPVALVALSGGQATSSTPSPSHFEPQGTRYVVSRPLIKVPRRSVVAPAPNTTAPEAASPRQSTTAAAIKKLNRLDNRIADLALNPVQVEQVDVLRAKVMNALVNLNDLSVGLDAGEQGLGAALAELEFAIQALAAGDAAICKG